MGRLKTRYRKGPKKKCLECGKIFTAKYENRQFCCTECYSKYYYRRKKQKERLKKLKQRKIKF